jgi:hypothetical protein
VETRLYLFQCPVGRRPCCCFTWVSALLRNLTCDLPLNVGVWAAIITVKAASLRDLPTSWPDSCQSCLRSAIRILSSSGPVALKLASCPFFLWFRKSPGIWPDWNVVIRLWIATALVVELFNFRMWSIGGALAVLFGVARGLPVAIFGTRTVERPSAAMTHSKTVCTHADQ